MAVPTAPTAEFREQLLVLIRGFRVSQAIYVAARLGIADLLVDGPKNSGELAQATGMHARSLYRVLRACQGRADKKSAKCEARCANGERHDGDQVRANWKPLEHRHRQE